VVVEVEVVVMQDHQLQVMQEEVVVVDNLEDLQEVEVQVEQVILLP
tara:strand:+ start:112 stop:249 length:138 start_codon:yes stop_codon:yes gene_type:complete